MHILERCRTPAQGQAGRGHLDIVGRPLEEQDQTHQQAQPDRFRQIHHGDIITVELTVRVTSASPAIAAGGGALRLWPSAAPLMMVGVSPICSWALPMVTVL